MLYSAAGGFFLCVCVCGIIRKNNALMLAESLWSSNSGCRHSEEMGGTFQQ